MRVSVCVRVCVRASMRVHPESSSSRKPFRDVTCCASCAEAHRDRGPAAGVGGAEGGKASNATTATPHIDEWDRRQPECRNNGLVTGLFVCLFVCTLEEELLYYIDGLFPGAGFMNRCRRR